MHRVLLLEDHTRLAALVRQALEGAGLACDSVERASEAWFNSIGSDGPDELVRETVFECETRFASGRHRGAWVHRKGPRIGRIQRIFTDHTMRE